MIMKGIDPDEFTYNVLISCLCRDGMVVEAIGLLEVRKIMDLFLQYHLQNCASWIV